MEMTEEDDELRGIISLLKTNEQRPSRDYILCYDHVTKSYWAQWPKVVYKNGLLYRRFESVDGFSYILQWIPPGKCSEKLFEYVHSGMTGGHYGLFKTLSQVQRRAYWLT